jgi:DNA-binding transcriptional LysR family regulator
MTRNLDTNLLRTFAAIAECGGFARAAKAVHLSQPTVSLQMKRLEEQTEATLFQKNGRAMVLTEEGHNLLRYARKILDLNDEAWTAVSAGQLTGSVRLGVFEDLLDFFLPDVLSRFTRAHPGVRLDMTVAHSAHLYDLIAKGMLDLAFMLRRQGQVGAETVRREKIRWIASEEYDLKTDGELPLIMCEAPCGFRETAVKALEDSDIKARTIFTSASFAGVKAAVKSGLGVTLRGESAATDGLIAIDDDIGLPPLPDYEIVLARRENLESMAADTLAKLLSDAAAVA